LEEHTASTFRAEVRNAKKKMVSIVLGGGSGQSETWDEEERCHHVKANRKEHFSGHQG
jgi:hypothetical protein